MLRSVIIAVALLSGVFAASGQQRTVIAGLEGNAEYLALVDSERALVRTADSLAAEIASLRRALRTDTLARETASAAIVRMEEAGFELRSDMARLASRINTFEQEWILANLSAAQPVADSDGDSGLEPEQAAELRRAQAAESGVPPLVALWHENHAAAAALARDYGLASTGPEADSIRTLFDKRRQSGDNLAQAIGREWSTIFDSKSYLYNLQADKQNRRTLLSRFNEGMERLREESSRLQDSGAPAPLVDYVLQKRMLTDYELALATELGNSAAADSLRAVQSALPGPASLAALAPVTLKERLFLDYSDVRIGSSPYTSANPIPEVAVWPRGIIWRVQVGSFSARQSPSAFRGVHPLSVQSNSGDGRFRYFAGGFPTDSLAADAVARLRRAGFRSPFAVVWMDGVMVDPATQSEKIYRVEISGIESLSPAIRDAVAGADIVRAGATFIVTPLDGPVAVRLRGALESLKPSHPGVEIKLSKISE